MKLFERMLDTELARQSLGLQATLSATAVSIGNPYYQKLGCRIQEVSIDKSDAGDALKPGERSLGNFRVQDAVPSERQEKPQGIFRGC